MPPSQYYRPPPGLRTFAGWKSLILQSLKSTASKLITVGHKYAVGLLLVIKPNYNKTKFSLCQKGEQCSEITRVLYQKKSQLLTRCQPHTKDNPPLEIELMVIASSEHNKGCFKGRTPLYSFGLFLIVSRGQPTC